MNYKKSLYHIAIAGTGFILQGSPYGVSSGRRYARSMGEAPVNGATITQFDAEFVDASSFIPWAQIDWSGGFQFDKWEDNAGFENGSALEYIKKYKEVTLLNDRTTVKDFGAGFTFGAAVQYDRDNVGLLVGVTKGTGGSQLWKISTGNTATQISSGFSNVNAVNAMDVCGQLAFIGCTVSSGKPLKTYTAAAGIADITLTGSTALASSTAIRMTVKIEERIYIGGYSGTAATGDAIAYSDDYGANWTDVVNKTGINRVIGDAVESLGMLYYLIKDGGSTELHQINDTTHTEIYTWQNLTSPTLKSWLCKVYIMGFESGKLRRYEWNGAQMKTVFEEKLTGLDLDASPMIIYLNNLLSYGLIYDGTYNFPSYNFKYSTNKCYPFTIFGAAGAEVPFFYGLSGTNLIVSVLNSNYQTTGNVYTGIYYGKKAAVDKLWANITIGFKALIAGQGISVDYSIDGETTWVNIGSITPVSGETERILYFPNNTISKRIQLRFTLTSSGSDTPTLYSYVGRFLNMPDIRYYWTFRLDCRDKLTLLDGKTQEPKRSIELRNILLNAKVSKQVVELQDVDFSENQLNGAIASTDTTITVDSTSDFPEQGRLKIDQEEILYTGLTAFTFTGCVRGARGTKATSHLDNARVHNGYNVILNSLSEINLVTATAKIDESILSIVVLEI